MSWKKQRPHSEMKQSYNKGSTLAAIMIYSNGAIRWEKMNLKIFYIKVNLFQTQIRLQRKVSASGVIEGERDLDLVRDERSVGLTHFLLCPLSSEQKDTHAPLMNHQSNSGLF